MSEIRLTLHDEAIATTAEGLPGGLSAVGLRDLVIRDQHGNRLIPDAMALGPFADFLAGVMGPAVKVEGGPTPAHPVITRKATLDRSADYLLIAVRCDRIFTDRDPLRGLADR